MPGRDAYLDGLLALSTACLNPVNAGHYRLSDLGKTRARRDLQPPRRRHSYSLGLNRMDHQARRAGGVITTMPLFFLIAPMAFRALFRRRARPGREERHLASVPVNRFLQHGGAYKSRAQQRDAEVLAAIVDAQGQGESAYAELARLVGDKPVDRGKAKKTRYVDDARVFGPAAHRPQARSGP